RTAELLGAGVLVGVAALYKYQAAVHLPLYLGHLAIVHRRRAVQLFRGWGAIGLGVALPLGLSLWAVKRAGALDAALFWFSFNAAYIRQGFRLSDFWARAARVSYGVLPAVCIWILGLRAVVLGWRRRGEDPLGLFMVGWCALSALAVSAGGRFFGHYFHQMTAPLAVLAAPEAARLWRSRRAFSLVALGLPAAVFLIIGLLRAPAAKAVGVGAPDYQAIAGFVRAHSAPTDLLVVWGNLPVLYFEADRPLGSRFVFSNYLTGLSPATRTQSDPSADASANVVAESWEMFLADLNSRQPEIFVDTSPGNLGAYGKFPLARFPRLQAIVDRHYSPIGEVGGARVFVRR
ncbi:MAG TPA: hypothetical protein VLA79_13420, partial [Polyangia bacterium]|nr:hypothetical protein [Polyangia bacterium]